MAEPLTLEEFTRSAADDPEPPPGLPQLLLALWHDARGNWPRAHELAQEVAGEDGAWVHAYLHRKEGDPSNARYWYRHANRPECRETLEREWQQIAEQLLESPGR